jgi:dienelactone hydrolase
MVVHDWNGPDDYEKGRAKQLAGLGYTAFVVDIYGRGVRPKNQQESAAESGKYGKDRMLTQKRIVAAMNYAMRQPSVDPKRIAAIGYCFGGMVVMELARTGSPIRGVVAFHGNLSNPRPALARFIKSQVLVLHGADDPFVPPAQVAGFESEMKAAKRPYKLIKYPGAVHSFTLKHAGSDTKSGAAYNEAADRKSWTEMQGFLKRAFK